MQLPVHFPSLPHRLLAHALVVGVVHEPEPLHTEAVVALPAVQLPGVQTVLSLGRAQALPLLPSHCPLHVPAPPQAACVLMGSPFTTLHFPTEPVSLQDSHWPSHEVSQQTPSTQCLDLHCCPAAQLEESASLGKHAPVLSQYEAVSQEVAVQLVAHVALPSVAQRLFGQALLVGDVHAPALLQTDAVVTLPPSHFAGEQTIESSG